MHSELASNMMAASVLSMVVLSYVEAFDWQHQTYYQFLAMVIIGMFWFIFGMFSNV